MKNNAITYESSWYGRSKQICVMLKYTNNSIKEVNISFNTI